MGLKCYSSFILAPGGEEEERGAREQGRGHTSFSPTATSKTLPRGITCAISPKATLSLLPLTNFTLSPSITSGLLPVCLNLANSTLSDSRIRSIAASNAEKSSGSTGTLLFGPIPPFPDAVMLLWEADLSFFLQSGAVEVRGRDWERKGGEGLGRRRRHVEEGLRGRIRVIRVLAGWGVSIIG